MPSIDPKAEARLRSLGRRLTAAWRAAPRHLEDIVPLVRHGVLPGDSAVAIAVAAPPRFGLRREVVGELFPLLGPGPRASLLAVIAGASGWRAWGSDALAQAALDGGEHAWIEALFAAHAKVGWHALPIAVLPRLAERGGAALTCAAVQALAADIAETSDLDETAEVVLRGHAAFAPADAVALADAIAARLATEELPWFDSSDGEGDTRLILAEIYLEAGAADRARAWIERAESDPFPLGDPPAPPGPTLASARLRRRLAGWSAPRSPEPCLNDAELQQLRARIDRLPPAVPAREVLNLLVELAACAGPTGPVAGAAARAQVARHGGDRLCAI